MKHAFSENLQQMQETPSEGKGAKNYRYQILGM